MAKRVSKQKQQPELLQQQETEVDFQVNFDSFIYNTSFIGGNITNCYEKWKEITTDQEILNIVKEELKLDFIYEKPTSKPYEYPFSEKKTKL